MRKFGIVTAITDDLLGKIKKMSGRALVGIFAPGALVFCATIAVVLVPQQLKANIVGERPMDLKELPIHLDFVIPPPFSDCHISMRYCERDGKTGFSITVDTERHGQINLMGCLPGNLYAAELLIAAALREPPLYCIPWFAIPRVEDQEFCWLTQEDCPSIYGQTR